MRIPVDTIPDEGVRVTIEGDEPWAVDVATAVLEVPAHEVGGHLHVQRRSTALQVRGRVGARGTRLCERCGEPVDLVIDSDPALSYVPVEDAPEGGGEIRLAPGDLDLGWYREGVLDLADVLSEALALELPPRITCADAQACDARVEARLPREDDDVSDSPFAALRSLV